MALQILTCERLKSMTNVREERLRAWSLLLLAATVRSFAHMPLGISGRNSSHCINRTGIQRSQCMQYVPSHAFRAAMNFTACGYDNRSDVQENFWALMVWQTSCWNEFLAVVKVAVMTFFARYLTKRWQLLQDSYCNCATALSKASESNFSPAVRTPIPAPVASWALVLNLYSLFV